DPVRRCSRSPQNTRPLFRGCTLARMPDPPHPRRSVYVCGRFPIWLSSGERMDPAMTDHPSFDHVDHHFADVGGPVGDALQILGDEREPDCPAYGGRVLNHVGEKLAEYLLHESIDLIILGDDGASPGSGVLDESHRAC